MSINIDCLATSRIEDSENGELRWVWKTNNLADHTWSLTFSSVINVVRLARLIADSTTWRNCLSICEIGRRDSNTVSSSVDGELQEQHSNSRMRIDVGIAQWQHSLIQGQMILGQARLPLQVWAHSLQLLPIQNKSRLRIFIKLYTKCWVEQYNKLKCM